MAWPSLLSRTKDWGTEVLTDTDLEGQFDLIINYVNDALHSSTGHKHDGTTSEGPKLGASSIDLTDDYTWTGTHDFSGGTIDGLGLSNPSRGAFNKLTLTNATAATITLSADSVVVSDGSGTKALAESVSETLDLSASGANGLDTGSEASSTWYYIWVIRKSSDETVDGLISTSTTAPTMPADYDQKALVGAFYNDSSSDILDFMASGREYNITTAVIASGIVTQTSYTDMSIATACPPNCVAKLTISHDDGGPWYIKTKGSTADMWISVGLGGSTGYGFADISMLVDSSSLVQYKHTSSTNRNWYVNCFGFTFTIGA